MFYRAKNWIITVLALALCLLFATFLYAKETVLLSKTQGARTFYLDSASSQSLIKTELALSDLPRVRGESVFFVCEGKDCEKDVAQQIFKKYGGTVTFVEAASGVVSYYGYAADLGKPILLYGQAINLHVAVGENRVAVGTPIIFGGF